LGAWQIHAQDGRGCNVIPVEAPRCFAQVEVIAGLISDEAAGETLDADRLADAPQSSARIARLTGRRVLSFPWLRQPPRSSHRSDGLALVDRAAERERARRAHPPVEVIHHIPVIRDRQLMAGTPISPPTLTAVSRFAAT